MNRTKRHLLAAAILIALLAIPTLVVFAKELGSLTISGPGIKGEMSINHPGGMMKLEQSGFFDQASFVKPPDHLGAGYELTAYLNLDGKSVPFVQMVYYATDNGGPGYVHYTARLNGETLKKVDEWSKLSKDANAAFLGLMAENGITLEPAIVSVAAAKEVVNAPAQPAQVPAKAAEQTASQQPISAPLISSVPASYIVATAVAVALLLAGAGLALRRRAINHTTT